MKWNIKIFTYIEPNYLLQVFLNDKEYLKKIIDELIFFYYRISKKVPIITTNLILDYINMYPRITHFITGNYYPTDIVSILDFGDSPFSRYIYSATQYQNYNKSHYKFIYSNYILPHCTNSSIPFSFGFKKDNSFKLVNSTVYYFEVYLDTFIFRNPSFDEVLKIGIIDSLSDCHDFGKDVFCGLDFFNSIIFNQKHFFIEDFYDDPIVKGDTIGFTLEYLNKYSYSFSLTKNGRKQGAYYYFETKRKLKLVLQMKMFTGININFGDKEFVFDIEKYINERRGNVSINSNNNKLIKHHDIRYFKPYKSKIISELINISI